MQRGSKHNTYECPECSYKSSRKYNLSIHMGRVHDLSLSPYLFVSQKDWVWAQRRVLERHYVEAENEQQERETYNKLSKFLNKWGDKGYWSFSRAIPESWDARRKHQEMVAKIKDK